MKVAKVITVNLKVSKIDANIGTILTEPMDFIIMVINNVSY